MPAGTMVKQKGMTYIRRSWIVKAWNTVQCNEMLHKGARKSRDGSKPQGKSEEHEREAWGHRTPSSTRLITVTAYLRGSGLAGSNAAMWLSGSAAERMNEQDRIKMTTANLPTVKECPIRTRTDARWGRSRSRFVGLSPETCFEYYCFSTLYGTWRYLQVPECGSLDFPRSSAPHGRDSRTGHVFIP